MLKSVYFGYTLEDDKIITPFSKEGNGVNAEEVPGIKCEYLTFLLFPRLPAAAKASSPPASSRSADVSMP